MNALSWKGIGNGHEMRGKLNLLGIRNGLFLFIYLFLEAVIFLIFCYNCCSSSFQ